MYRLSEKEIDIVYQRLSLEELNSRRLGHELLDHVCCSIEEKITEGADFETAYENAISGIVPNGTKEIEFELFFIINFQKQISMKKVIFITGFISAFLLSTGIMFKTMKWFMSNVLLVTGFALLVVTLLMLSIYIKKYVKNQSIAFRVRSFTGIISVLLIATGLIFRIFTFDGANILYGLGTITFNFIFLPLFFYHLYKTGFSKTEVSSV